MPQQNPESAFYRQGVEALERQDWPTAANMFRLCVRLAPDNLRYAQLTA